MKVKKKSKEREREYEKNKFKLIYLGHKNFAYKGMKGQKRNKRISNDT
jgi:hypothetical protein